MTYLLDVVYNRDIWMHRVDIDRATGCGMLSLGYDGSDPELVHRLKAARLLF